MTPLRRCRNPRAGPGAAAIAIAAIVAGPPPARAAVQVQEDACPRAGAREAAWVAYRDGRLEEARAGFEGLLACRPGDAGARTGLGYVALRGGREPRAAELFDGVLAADSTIVDALVGRGLVAWRRADVALAGRLAGRALLLSPGHAEARALLDRIEGSGGSTHGAAERPPPVLPDTVEARARTRGDRFEVRTADGWEPFYIKGVNLGAALPGRHPGQFPDADTYARWIERMGAMGANVVRTYTIHPPAFYEALRRHNLAHPDLPLWLVHGVWTGLPPGDDYEDPEWEGAFFGEMRRVVDVLHGRADLPSRPGRASGTYVSDVSRWTLAYIVGREWEPYSVEAFNARHPGRRGWNGRYLTLDAGTAMEAWLARACESMVAYETATYRTQRPIAYTNWPTLDPLDHPTETTVDEEVAIRESLGETVEVAPLEYDNDGPGLETGAIRTTPAFRGGYFAAYHAYPYYPDFMILDPEYATARSPWGRSSYFGYLRALKARHPDVPVIVAEYGVPASIGAAHLQPQGWHHGGHTEAAMADIDVRLTREIAEAGFAGGILFAWIDEWFKKNWLVIDFEIPLDRNRLWLNRLDPEQQYGILAMDPGSGVPGATPAERAAAWAGRQPLYRSMDGSTLRAAADEAYLSVYYETGGGSLPDRLLVGFDTVDPAAGDRRWPDRIGAELPVGVEFVLEVTSDEARILADTASNPFRLVPVREERPLGPVRAPPRPPAGAADDRVPGGTFTARREQRFRRPFRSRPNADGRYDSLRVITNRPRFARDSTEYVALGYDRGLLPRGPLPDGLWEADTAAGRIEVRIPWMLLNVTDPSARRVLQELAGGVTPVSIGAEAPVASEPADGGFGTVTVPDIGIVAAAARGDEVVPLTGPEGTAARFAWDGWETPRWTSRTRPLYDALRRAFETLDPAVWRADRTAVRAARDEEGDGR